MQIKPYGYLLTGCASYSCTMGNIFASEMFSISQSAALTALFTKENLAIRSVGNVDLQPNIVYKQNVFNLSVSCADSSLYQREPILWVVYILSSYQKGPKLQGVEVILYIQILKYSTIFKDKNLMF